MQKKKIKPSTYIYPAPVMLISSRGRDGKPNIATISWGGVLCSDPPMVGISVRPKRHTNSLIKETMEFVLNIPSKNQLKETDYCGSVSGRDSDKFLTSGFTSMEADTVKAPLIKECPINLECQVRQIINLGSHDLFIAEVVSAHVDEEILDGERINMEKLSPVSYCPNVQEYRAMGEKIGSYGFSKNTGGV
ncbi:MAG: flavin reductase family protein [Nitrospirae bacterium]|nr:flavin reductase family protein [Nitrospirota bacterium]